MNKENVTIIFDFDGTIVDISTYLENIVKELSREFKLRKVTKRGLEKLRGVKTKDFFKKLGIPAFRVPLIINRARMVFADKIGQITPVEGIGDAIAALKRKEYRVGILTSNSKKNAETFLKNNKLDFFDFVYSEKNIFSKGKMLKILIGKEGLKKEEIFYVGDEDRDVEAAREADVKSVGVTWGSCSEKLMAKSEPDFIARKPEDLVLIFVA